MKTIGYTHYYNANGAFTDTEWALIRQDVIKLFDNMPRYSESGGGCYGHESIALEGRECVAIALEGRECVATRGHHLFPSSEVLWFNGIGEFAHETFVVNQNGNKENFDFCKTARKPYDLMVGACLVVCAFHGRLTFSSDGEPEDWQPIYDFVTEVLGSEYLMKLKMEGHDDGR